MLYMQVGLNVKIRKDSYKNVNIRLKVNMYLTFYLKVYKNIIVNQKWLKIFENTVQNVKKWYIFLFFSQIVVFFRQYFYVKNINVLYTY